LLEQFTFYGACRKFNLDFYCKGLGIMSPKRDGINGLDIGRLFEAGEYHRIPVYCLDDAKAAAELYHRWLEYLAFSGRSARSQSGRRKSETVGGKNPWRNEPVPGKGTSPHRITDYGEGSRGQRRENSR
jgi:hypothetical protein